MRIASGRAPAGARTFMVEYGGEPVLAQEGDTLASALMAAGRLVIGADPVTGRPRGLRWLDRRSELSVAVTGLRGTFDPCHLHLSEGMKIRLVEKPAKLPRASGEAEADVLVIGAGPAGLIAAETAVGGGARVILVDREPVAGGALRYTDEKIGTETAAEWCAARAAQLARAGVEIMLNAEVLPGTGDDWRVLRHDLRAVWTLRARQTVLATGAVARMPIFAGNDLPGVMTAAAMRRLLASQGVIPGRRIAIFASGDEGDQTAAVLQAAGAEVVALVDLREDTPEGDWPIERGSVVSAAEGEGRLQGIVIDGPRGQRRVECDGLAVATGWSPQISALLERVRPIWNPTISAWLVPPGTPDRVHSAGAAGGTYTTRGVVKSGYFRARRALAELNRVAPPVRLPEAGDEVQEYATCWHVPGPGPAFAEFARGLTFDRVLDGVESDDPAVIAGRYVADSRLT